MMEEIHSVFDIVWYSYARMVADVAPPTDDDLNYMFSQGSILTCVLRRILCPAFQSTAVLR